MTSPSDVPLTLMQGDPKTFRNLGLVKTTQECAMISGAKNRGSSTTSTAVCTRRGQVP